MKTAAALILCLGCAAASDEEQARARLQRAVEKVRAGVKKGPSLPSAPAGAGGSARRLAGGSHVGVISRATYPDNDPDCATRPLRWDVMPSPVNTNGACESFSVEGQTYSTSGSCASATSFSSNFYQGSSCSGTPQTTEVTNNECKVDYHDEYSYSYSYSFGDDRGYYILGCPDIPEADVEATTTFYHPDSGTCDDANALHYMVWAKGCILVSQPDDLIKVFAKFSCDANVGLRHEFFIQNSDCTGAPFQTSVWEDMGTTDTCLSLAEPNSWKKIVCGCAAGVGCSTSVVDAAAARGPLLAAAVLGAAAAAL